MKKITYLLLGSFLLLLVAYGIRSNHVDNSDAKHGKAEDASNAADGFPHRAPHAPVSLRSQEFAGVQSKFEQSRNLKNLINEMSVSAEQGDREAARLLAMAKTECAGSAVDPYQVASLRTMAEKIQDPSAKNATIRNIRIYEERCSELSRDGITMVRTIEQQWRNADALGDPVAKAFRLVERGAVAGGAAAKAEIEEIVRSKNPQAIALLSEIMGPESSGREDVLGPYSGSQVARAAWLLAACDLGMNCGPESYTVRQLCLKQQICSDGDLWEVIQRALLPPPDFLKAKEMEKKLMDSWKN